MIIVREIFTAKPGMASKLAKMFKEWSKDMPGNTRVMTDAVGEYNTVVMESEYENLTAFEKSVEEYMKKSRAEKKSDDAPKYTEMYLTGRREIFRVV